MPQIPISVIIPFYNEELYLERAVNSVLAQSYRHFELLLINDFSVDNSTEIALNYAKTNGNITLLNSEKKGISGARNTGLKAIKGTYFCFLDADDEWHPDYLSISLQKITEHEADILICNIEVFDTNDRVLPKFDDNFEDRTHEGQMALMHVYNYEINPSVWGKLIKTELIGEFQFAENVYFEDKPFVVYLFLKTTKIAQIKSKLYFHYANTVSITRQFITKERIVGGNNSFFVDLVFIEKMASQDLKPLFYQKAFRFQWNIMLDLFFIATMDHQQINKKEIFDTLASTNKKIVQKAESLKVSFSFKSRVLIFVLLRITHKNWRIPLFLLKQYRKKQYAFIQNIRA